MKTSHPEETFSDGRGVIRDLLEKETIDSVTMITSRPGAVRGNHYHKETWQWIYLLSGRLRYVTRFSDGMIAESYLAEGDMLLSEPLEVHAMEAVTECRFLVFTRGPRGGRDYESDTYRVEPPLIASGCCSA